MTAPRVYTDGSCAAPGAVGGWAWILVGDDVIACGSGVTPGSSTHQAAEVTAAIAGLSYVEAFGLSEVELVSDSRYLVDGMSRNGRTGWAHVAAASEWRTTRRQPLKNRVLWERLLELESRLPVTWRHVLGHRPKTDTSDDARYNREVDVLAGQARRNFLAPAPQTSGATSSRTTSATPSKSAATATRSWRDLPDTQKAEHLLAKPTISDSSWTNEKRLPGESRTAFVGRILKVRV
jgi:ribonuclease HI